MTRVLSLRVSDEVAARIDAVAVERGVKRTELLARFVEEGLHPVVRVDAQSRDVSARRFERARASAPVTSAADLLRERQVRLNKQLGWAPKS